MFKVWLDVLGYSLELPSDQITSSISWNVKLDIFSGFLLRKIREQVSMCIGFILTWSPWLKSPYHGIPWKFYIHRTNIKRWEKLWTFAMPSNLAKSSPVFRNSFATREKAAVKFLWGTSLISHIKCMVETFISSNVCMKFGHKKVFGEVRRWIVNFFENLSINACRLGHVRTDPLVSLLTQSTPQTQNRWYV